MLTREQKTRIYNLSVTNTRKEIAEKLGIRIGQVDGYIDQLRLKEKYRDKGVIISKEFESIGLYTKQSEVIMCACGCRRFLLKYDLQGNKRKSISGHLNWKQGDRKQNIKTFDYLPGLEIMNRIKNENERSKRTNPNLY